MLAVRKTRAHIAQISNIVCLAPVAVENNAVGVENCCPGSGPPQHLAPKRNLEERINNKNPIGPGSLDFEAFGPARRGHTLCTGCLTKPTKGPDGQGAPERQPRQARAARAWQGGGQGGQGVPGRLPWDVVVAYSVAN